ncbi:MAG: hypothetical protein KDD06_13605 [Phaeodactylibacter sp.]|nr:hypothetical protein [Phaeodactylibacter sp.]MCB9265176.1 hypothetical protein [Lewinellaceae bacterium]MCB9285962.1 hypothetical protein [Lewinellaceae bacterium]
MITELRKQFNENFRPEAYQGMLDFIAEQYKYRPPFRIAETPVFVPGKLKKQLIEACEEITDVIAGPNFRELSKGALLAGQEVPGETPHTTFLQMDFGICLEPNGELKPQLIEVQGFPSLYFYQDLAARAYRQFYNIPDNVSHLFGGLSSEEYIEMLRRIILGDHEPENVILLEVEPEKQTTAIDFIAGKHLIGLEPVCVSQLKVQGREVFYPKDGRLVKVEKIYNRVIFDELIKRDDLPREFYFTEGHDVEFIGHPNWFFRISKHTLPLLDSQYVPKSYFLNEVDSIPEDLHNYVLKPLYSFAGTGVIINLNRHDIEAISDPENYILQRKVDYAPVIPTPTEPAKCEIRMLMLWDQGAERPVIVNNLARVSKGLMVGVRYNRDKDWVGGSVGFFEKD